MSADTDCSDEDADSQGCGRYLIRKRLQAACDLLRLNQEPTARIAARVGIENPFYFSRLFRNRFGLTPTQYRAHYASKDPKRP